jgi:hypothetical protein
MAALDAGVRSLKWKLWHAQTGRALKQIKTMTNEFGKLREQGNLSATSLLYLALYFDDLCPPKQMRDH